MAEPERPRRLVALLATALAVVSSVALFGRRSAAPQAAVSDPAGSSGTARDATLGAAPDATLGAAPDATLGAAPDATLGAAPDATLGAAPDATLGAAHAASGQVESDEAVSGRGEPTVPPNPKAESLGYETEDISASMVGRILGGFAATVVVSVMLLFVMIHFFRGADNADQPALTTQQSADIVPPGPHLQRDPYRDLRDQHGAEEQKLAGYAWADPAHTRVRIPIDRAMALVAGRSLEPSP